jgi:hypothetical protein
MSELVSTPTKCKLCNHVFKTDLLGSAAIIGASKEAKMQQVAALTKPLMKHLQKHHPEHIQRAQISGMELAGYLTVTGAFEMDEHIRQTIGTDFTRWHVHRLTRNLESHPTDGRIKERVGALFANAHPPNPSLSAAVVVLLCEMRDAIEEVGRYPEPQAIPQNGKPPA